MSEAPVKTRSILRKMLVVLLIVAVLAGSLHLFLYYRAGALFKAFVEQMSEGAYTASTKTLRFAYLPFRIRASEVRFYPMDTTDMPRWYDISADSIQLRLSSLAPILFYNSLEVRDVRLVRPRVQVFSDGSRASREEVKFNIPIQEIQNGLLKGLDLLQVDKCVIEDGGFNLMRTDIRNNLAINHIDLTIDSLLAAKKGMLLDNGDTVSAQIFLRLNKPDIIIPDSNIRVDVEQLVVDTRRNLFNINELRFSRLKNQGAYDTIKLSSIALSGLIWKQFLNEGIVELDSVRVKNGLAQIDLTDRLIFQKRRDKIKKERAEIEVPLILHHVSVEQVNYQLRSKRKTGLFTILLDGDSLKMEQFTLLNTTRQPVSIGSLSLNVKNYYDQDDKRTYMAGFDRLAIKNNNLNIINYRLVPLRREGFSANNQVLVPSLSLYGYDIGELLKGRLEADRLVLNEPRVIIDILQKEQRQGLDSTKSRGLFEVLHRLQQTLDIDELNIRDATFVLQPRSNFADTIVISQLSTNINVERLLAANAVADLMKVTEGVRSDGFFITGSRFQFKVTDAVISAESEQLEMKRLQGSLSSGLEMDLDNVLVRSKPGEMLIPVDGLLNLQRLSVGGGNVMVRGRGVPGAITMPGQKPAPVLNIDSLLAGALQLSYINAAGGATTVYRLALDVKGLYVNNGDVRWIDAVMKGAGLKTASGDMNIRAASWEGKLPGDFSLQGIRVWPKANTLFGVTTEIGEVKLQNQINRVAWDGKSIEEVEVIKPVLRWTFSSGNGNAGNPESKFAFPIFLKKLTITDPDLDGYRLTKSGQKRHSVVNGGSIEIHDFDLYHAAPDILSMSSVTATLPGPEMEVDSNWTLKPASVRLVGNNIYWKKGELPRGIMDTALVKGIGNIPVFTNERQRLEIDHAGVSDWYFPTPLDSFIFKLANGPNWWVGGANYSFSGEQNDIFVYNASARRQNRVIQFDSMKMVPHLTRDSFWASQPFEKDYITLKIGPTTIENFQPASLNLNGAHIQRLFTKGIDIYAARDKQVTDDTIRYRPMIANQMRKLPMDFTIDTLSIEDGHVLYHEIGEKNGMQGTFEMNELNGNIYNIYTMYHPDSDSLRLDVRARLWNSAPMHLRFAQSYQDSLQSFRLGINLGRWHMPTANQLLRPLNSIESRRGTADSMWLWALANDRYAYGWMGFKYQKLRVGILKNGRDEDYFMSGFVNGVANLVVKNNNNGKPTPVYFDRLQNKAILNYWSKILTTGLMGNLGMPGKKKQARKAMRKQNISTSPPGPDGKPL